MCCYLLITMLLYCYSFYYCGSNYFFVGTIGFIDVDTDFMAFHVFLEYDRGLMYMCLFHIDVFYLIKVSIFSTGAQKTRLTQS